MRRFERVSRRSTSGADILTQAGQLTTPPEHPPPLLLTGSTLRKQEGELHKKIQNLYAALAEGTAGDTVLFREALHGFENQREESIRLLIRFFFTDFGMTTMLRWINQRTMGRLDRNSAARYSQRPVRGFISPGAAFVRSGPRGCRPGFHHDSAILRFIAKSAVNRMSGGWHVQHWADHRGYRVRVSGFPLRRARGHI
jgi:hypothetical protein